MSWAGKDIIYSVSPGERHKIMKALTENTDLLNEIYLAIMELGSPPSNRLEILLNSNAVDRIPFAWKVKGKIEKIFGYKVEVTSGIYGDFELRSGNERY